MPHILFRFVVLGSFVAGGVFLVAQGIAEGTTGSLIEVALGVLAVPLLAALASFLSIPFGLFPAGCAAVLYWAILSRYTKSNPTPAKRAALGALVGAVSSGLFGGALFSISHTPAANPFVSNLLSWAIAGAAGGAASALATTQSCYVAAFKFRRSTSEA